MTAPATRTPVVSADIFGTTLTLNFPLTKGTPELSIDITTLDPEIIKQATLHGLKQKLADAAAIARNTSNGAAASPDDKYMAVKIVFDRITGPAPTWNAVREGVERAPNSVFVRAVAEATGKDVASTAIMVKALDKEKQNALKKNIRIVDIMHRMEREEAQKGGSGDDLLAMLSGDVEPEAPASDPTPTPAKKNGKRKTDADALPPTLSPMAY